MLDDVSKPSSTAWRVWIDRRELLLTQQGEAVRDYKHCIFDGPMRDIDFRCFDIAHGIFEADLTGAIFKLEQLLDPTDSLKRANNVEEAEIFHNGKRIVGLTIDPETGRVAALPRPNTLFLGNLRLQFRMMTENLVHASELVRFVEGLQFATQPLGPKGPQAKARPA